MISSKKEFASSLEVYNLLYDIDIKVFIIIASKYYILMGLTTNKLQIFVNVIERDI